MRKPLLFWILGILAALSLLFLAACDGDDDKSAAELEAQACGDLLDLADSLRALGTALQDPESTVGDVRTALDDARSARDTAKESVEKTAEARFSEVEEAYSSLATAIEEVPDDATLQEGREAIQANIDAVAAAEEALAATLCAEDGDETPEVSGPTATAEAPEDVPGVTDTEIILGTHQPLTGSPAAVYSQIAKVTQAYFEMINDTEGGVNGRKITLLIEDDQYTPSLTVDVVRKLVEQDEIFAMLNGLGTATHMSVVDYLQNEGVPDMYMSTGAIEWVKDPSARPMVFGTIPNYIAEGLVLGTYIAEEYAGGKLGFIGQNDDFGEDGLEGIKRGVGDALEILEPQWFEAVEQNVDAQIDQLQSQGATVVVIFAVPTQAAAGPRHAQADLGWDVPIIISGVSANELTIALTGEVGMEGVVSQAALYQAYETDNPAVQAHIDFLAEYAPDATPGFLTLYGQTVGELMVETLKRAGPDLTRQGLVEAAESIADFQCTVCLFAGTMSADDHDPTQSTQLVQVVDGKWTPFGKAYTWEGVTIDDLGPDTLEEITSPYE